MAAFDIGLNFSDGRMIELLEKAYDSAERLDRKLDDIRVSSSMGFANVGSGAQAFQSAMKTNIKAADTGSKALVKLGAASGVAFSGVNLISGAVTSVASGIGNFAANTVRLGAGLESVQANFTVFLKSADKANELLAELNKFAAATPFTQNEIFGNAEKLLGFGFAADEVTDTLRRLGDISGGSADKLNGLVLALGQVRAKGKVQSDELLQFAERGVPIFEALATALGTNVATAQELVTKGKVGFADLQKAIRTLTDEGGLFNGVLEKQSQTFNGLFSTLTGNFEQLQGKIGQLLLPALKELVIGVNSIVESIDEKAIGAAFSQFGQDIAPFVSEIREGISKNVVPALLAFRDVVVENADRVGEFFGKFNENGAAANFLKSVLEVITIAFGGLIRTVAFAADAIGDFVSPIIDSLVPAFRNVTQLFTQVIDKFAELNTETPKAGGAFRSLGQAVAFFGDGISKSVELITRLISAIFGLKQETESTTPAIRAMEFVVNLIADRIRILIDFFVYLDGAIGRARSGFLDFFGLGESATNFTNFIKSRIGLIESETDKQARLNAEKQKSIDLDIAAKQAAADKDQETKRDLAESDRDGNRLTQAEIAVAKAKIDAAKQAAALTKAERDKIAKQQLQDEKEREKLLLDLIQDNTARRLEAEKRRFEKQGEDITRLIPKGSDLKGASEADRLKQDAVLNKARENALSIHTAKMLEIEKDGEKELADERNKAIQDKSQTIVRELDFLREREEANKKAAIDALNGQKTLSDLQIDIAQAASENFIERLRSQGASEEQLAFTQAKLDLDIQRLRIDRQITFQKDRLELLGAGNEQERKEILASVELLTVQLESVDLKIFDVNKAQKQGKEFVSIIADVRGAITGLLSKNLGVSSSIADRLLSDAEAGVKSFLNSFSEITELQIEQSERLIKTLDKQIEKQEEVLKKEKDNQEQGLANSVKTEQDKLDLLYQQKADAEKKNQDLQVKATKFQLLQDSAAQVSGIATAVVNIVKNSTKFSVLGVALAAIQVAALFGLLASARAKIKAAQSLHDGGEIPYGKTDEAGREGYRIEGTNIQVGGGEMVVRQKVTQRNKPFLSALNAGDYEGVDLKEMADTMSGKSGGRKAKNLKEFIRQHVRQVENETVTNETVRDFGAWNDAGTVKRLAESMVHGKEIRIDLDKKNVSLANLSNLEFFKTVTDHVKTVATTSKTIQTYQDRVKQVERQTQMKEAATDLKIERLERRIEEQTTVIRKGLLNLMQLGNHYTDADGNVVNVKMDYAGNKTTTKAK
jgi:tape measure domain-containing protein